uniref:non-specific serine/threonine protein kinase n=1 Tax=Anopheles coluzzii TaxID=1518534 RepID=A0A8W7PD05_ANOCL
MSEPISILKPIAIPELIAIPIPISEPIPNPKLISIPEPITISITQPKTIPSGGGGSGLVRASSGDRQEQEMSAGGGKRYQTARTQAASQRRVRRLASDGPAGPGGGGAVPHELAANVPADMRISKLLRRLVGETSGGPLFVELCDRLELVILDPSNASYVRKSFDLLAHTVAQILEGGLRECQDRVAQLFGMLLHVLVGGAGPDCGAVLRGWTDRYLNQSKRIRRPALVALRQLVVLDRTERGLEPVADWLVGYLQQILEQTDVLDVFLLVTDVMVRLADGYGHAFAPHFSDIVDIVVGWQLESTQPTAVKLHCARVLLAFRPFWCEQRDVTFNLLEQFSEDIDGHCGDVEYADRAQADDANRLFGALLTAFNSVFKCLQDAAGDGTFLLQPDELARFDCCCCTIVAIVVRLLEAPPTGLAVAAICEFIMLKLMLPASTLTPLGEDELLEIVGRLVQHGSGYSDEQIGAACCVHLCSVYGSLRTRYTVIFSKLPLRHSLRQVNEFTGVNRRRWEQIGELKNGLYHQGGYALQHSATLRMADLRTLFNRIAFSRDGSEYAGGYLHELLTRSFNQPSRYGEMALRDLRCLIPWAQWEAAQLCVNQKLRTPFGKPQSTFLRIESIVKQCARILALTDRFPVRDIRTSIANQRHARILLGFLEALEKSIYNAAEGTAYALPAPEKPARTFFRVNQSTCAEWFTRIRTAVDLVALHCMEPEMVIRYSEAVLRELVAAGKTGDPIFEHMLMSLVWALVRNWESDALYGVYVWSKRLTGRKYSWIRMAAEEASGHRETAASGFRSILADPGSAGMDRHIRDFIQVQTLVHELRRISLLWEELWVVSLQQIYADYTKRIPTFEAEYRRLYASGQLTDQRRALLAEKHRLLLRPLLFERYHRYIRNMLAKLREPADFSRPIEGWNRFRTLYAQLQQRSQKRFSFFLRLADVSPNLLRLSNTAIAMPGIDTTLAGSRQPILIRTVDNNIQILPTKTRPKKLTFCGNDGRRFGYLSKGLEDLHLDERIMQFLSIANLMMTKSIDCNGNVTHYRAEHYSVIPLGPRSGLITWVDHTVPIFSLYKKWQQREALQKKEGKGAGSSATLRPSELFYNKLTPLLQSHGLKANASRREWPLPVLKQVLAELQQETPRDLLAKELWCHSATASSWRQVIRSYSLSLAVMSVIGYIIGLGDRHLDNVLVKLATGEIVHIDYNVCFEKGKTLRVPEKVPFRMTPNLEEALGMTGIEVSG